MHATHAAGSSCRRAGARPLALAALGGLGLLTALPARAQTVEELRAQLNLLQRRIEQLEAAQRRGARQAAQVPATPPPAPQQQAARPPAGRGTGAAPGPLAARPGAVPPPEAADSAPPQVTSAIPVQAARADDAEAAARERFPGSFPIPGTDTRIRLYGFAKLNMSGDFGPRNRSDAITPQSIPLSRGALDARSEGDFQASARRSRLGIETRTHFDDAFGEIRTQVELDFAGQNTDLTTQATSNSYTPRLRQAFAEFGQFQAGGWGTVLVGQSNSLFNDGQLIPLQWLNDWTTPATSGVRQAQLRYTARLEGGVTLGVALENSYSDITSATGTNYPDSNGGAGFGVSHVPDLTARAIHDGAWGSIALRGVLREVRIDNGGAVPAQRYNDTTLGWGLGATGSLNLFDKRLILAGTLNYGQGLGRYLDSTSAGYSAVVDFGLAGVPAGGTKLDTVDVLAGMIGAQFFYTPSLRSNLSLHGARMSYPDYVRAFAGCPGVAAGSVCGGINRELWAGVANLIWSPVKPVDLGIEYVHVERTLENRDANGVRGGKADRIQASAIVRF